MEERMTWQFPYALMLVLGPAAGGEKPATYPQGKLLMEASELARPASARRYRVLDVRPLENYKEGHIAGATSVDTPAWNKQFTARQDQKAWEKRLGSLGIDVDTPVVVYGDDLRETARVWFILHYWGIKDLRILNGGWQAWTAAGNEVDKSNGPNKPEPKKVTLCPLPKRLAAKEQLLKDLKGKQVQIADARSKKEHSGEKKLAKRGGAIPGAIHLEWTEVLDKKTQRFKSPAELTQLFKKAGIDLTKPTVCYCQSGGRAAVLAFTLELMGAKDVRNYYRSWAEWGNAKDTPIEKPQK
jgi:thiosulfate/3-mercaptopyruvate sulfurtransferase